MEIRSYRESDEEAVLALWEACDLTRPWIDTRADIARKLTDQRELFLVGTIGGRVVGTVMGGHEGDRGRVEYLAVDPAHRERGLGKALMTHIEGLLLERGCPRVNLKVRVGNNEGIAFYRGIGYSQEAVLSFGRRLDDGAPKT